LGANLSLKERVGTLWQKRPDGGKGVTESKTTRNIWGKAGDGGSNREIVEVKE